MTEGVRLGTTRAIFNRMCVSGLLPLLVFVLGVKTRPLAAHEVLPTGGHVGPTAMVVEATKISGPAVRRQAERHREAGRRHDRAQGSVPVRDRRTDPRGCGSWIHARPASDSRRATSHERTPRPSLPIPVIETGVGGAGRKENTMENRSNPSKDKARWFDWFIPAAYEELKKKLQRMEMDGATTEEKVAVVENYQMRYEPHPDVMGKAEALLAEPGWKTLRRRIALRLSTGIPVFDMIGDRFDDVLVALRIGIERAAEGELLHPVEFGSVAVVKFLQQVDCRDMAREKNRILLSEMLAVYRMREKPEWMYRADAI